MLATDSLTSLFRDLVRSAMAAQQVESTETTEFYLVQLLQTFARPDRPDLLDPPLAIAYLDALQAPAWQRYGKLRRVGDTALFVTGVFVDSLERSAVGAGYYESLGRNAYARLSAEPSNGALAESFEELADRFPEFVRVFAEISEQELFRGDRDTIRVYRRWLTNRSERDRALLVRRGIIPFAPSTTERH